eukprot:COSAG06_NODE_37893_length_429_cov_42.724242_1_plen_25_part_10
MRCLLSHNVTTLIFAWLGCKPAEVR